MNMTGGLSNSNAGGNLVLISSTGSTDGGTSSLLGSSDGSDFGSSITTVSSHSKLDLLQHCLDFLIATMAGQQYYQRA